MKWNKLGQIFDPAQHSLPNESIEFAQSPQALVFDEYVRVYFSTRSVDVAGGKYRSHVAFVDFSRNLREIIRVSNHTVTPLGDLGSFDEHGIFPISPVRDGHRLLAYTTGWSRRVSTSVETAVGLTVSSDDGLTFERVGDGPILAASLHEPFLVGDAFVRIIDGVWHMWYIFGTEWKRYSFDSQPERTYKIAHAESKDGVEWIKDEAIQIVADRLGPNESQALPTVVRVGSRYHMFFCYRESFNFREAKARGYHIGHAWSEDLVNWTREDELPQLIGTPGEWDSDMQCYPNVFEHAGSIYLLYNGNEFGRRGFGLAVLEV